MLVALNKWTIVWVALMAAVGAAIIVGIIFTVKPGSEVKISPRMGAIVSNGRECADIGGQFMNDGGSAVDSAVATLICEAAMVPQSMGIGGGFVGVLYNRATNKVETVIARESAPAAAHKNMYLNTTRITGAISAGVPGELKGYWEMHQKYGKLPWKMLFQPTIKLCREGIYVSAHMQKALISAEADIRLQTALAEIFIKTDGTLLKEGEQFVRPDLANTLETIAENGPYAFYNGEVGRMFVEDVQELGGIITLEDLKNYRTRWSGSNGLVANMNGGYKLYSTPLPSSGPVLGFIIKVLNGHYTDDKSVFAQRITETFKHAYGQRTHLGDVEFEPDSGNDIRAALERLSSEEFANSIRALISDNSTSQNFSYYGADYSSTDEHGTANVAVLDTDGSAVVITSTINNYFGARVMSRRTGIILNDEMDDFSTPGVVNTYGLRSSPANYVQPNKMPLSSMCPSIILDENGDVRLLVGAAGGSKITTAVALTILRYLVSNDTMSTAIYSGRIHHQLAPMQATVETSVPEDIINYLRKVGHVVDVITDSSGFAAVTAIGARDRIPEPVFDSRRIGSTVTINAKNKMQH